MRVSPRTGLPLIPKSTPERSSRCLDAPSSELLHAIALFNQREYWHCHEVLEALWRSEPDAIRALYQGILLVGVGYLHLERGNIRGARTKLEQGIAYLAPSLPACQSVDVGALVRAAEETLKMLETPLPDRPVAFPTIRLIVDDAPENA